MFNIKKAKFAAGGSCCRCCLSLGSGGRLCRCWRRTWTFKCRCIHNSWSKTCRASSRITENIRKFGFKCFAQVEFWEAHSLNPILTIDMRRAARLRRRHASSGQRELSMLQSCRSWHFFSRRRIRKSGRRRKRRMPAVQYAVTAEPEISRRRVTRLGSYDRDHIDT